MVTKGKSIKKNITIPTSLNEIYTPEEVAESFRIDPRQLKKMRSEGRGPKPLFISPNVVRYRASAVEEYINAMSAGQDYCWDPELYCRTSSSGRSGQKDTVIAGHLSGREDLNSGPPAPEAPASTPHNIL